MNPKVRFAISFVDENLHRDIYVAEIAHLVSLSRSRFCHRFKSEVGMPLTQYLKKARIEKPCELLETSSKQIKEIGFEVGYNDPTHFEREFKRLTARHPCNIEPRTWLGPKRRRREKTGRFDSNSTFL